MGKWRLKKDQVQSHTVSDGIQNFRTIRDLRDHIAFLPHLTDTVHVWPLCAFPRLSCGHSHSAPRIQTFMLSINDSQTFWAQDTFKTYSWTWHSPSFPPPSSAKSLCFCLCGLYLSTITLTEIKTSWHYSENSVNLTDPLKGSQGHPRVPRLHFENSCSL